MVPEVRKRVLVVEFSQSGQLSEVVRSFAGPLLGDPRFDVHVEALRPRRPYPFPWPILRFFDTFPEAVHLDPPELEPLGVRPGERFDLVILGYTVWFLSPSLPVTAFLKSDAARAILRDTPVVTVVACRDMWLMAQEQVKALLAESGARLVGHAAFTDEAGSAGSFLATPVWVMSGHKGPHWGGLIPRAGVHPEKIRAASRFGRRIADVLAASQPLDATLLRGLDAVRVNERLITSERFIRRGLRLWGSLFRALGPQGAPVRKPVLLVYIVWLVLMILTVVPLAALLKVCLAPFTRQRIAAQKAYFGAPSGSP
jgi:hypothetical protein